MFDRYMFAKIAAPNFDQFERKTLEFGAADVERYNALQVVKSNQYVFCPVDKFELADRLCNEFPQICDANRKRVQVDATSVSRGTANISLIVLDERRSSSYLFRFPAGLISSLATTARR